MSRIPASMQPEPKDPETERLQALWHERRKEWVAEGSPDTGQAWQALSFIDTKLSDRLWRKAAMRIEEDRRKHPKAKRNQGVPTGDTGKTRLLP